MRKCVVILIAIAAIALLPPSVWANLVPITATDGVWTNGQPVGAATINNATDPRTARWGTGGALSGYNWSPAATPFNADSSGVAFSLGTFNHLNFPIGGTPITSIDLDFSLQIDGLAPLLGTFHFIHDETPNAVPCAYPSTTPCADAVTVSSPFLNTPFNYLGVDYFFSLLGFSQDGGATTVNKFITQENQENIAGLYGVITEIPIGVPEPSTLLLLASGLVGLGGMAWRRRKN